MSQHTSPRCLVLGGAGYVGSAVCRLLYECGARLAFTYHTGGETARVLAEELKGSFPLHADLASYAETRRVVREAGGLLGGLDALIQCAGTAGDPTLYTTRHADDHGKFLAITEAEWDAMFDVTVRSTFAACQEATLLMSRNQKNGGSIVIVGSIDGIKPLPAPVHYAAGKGALRSLTEALAKELGRDNIRVNLVAPGILEGGIARHLEARLLQDYLEHCALKRAGKSDEVAEVIVRLALDNTYVTGQSIVLDGGL
ncbi:MAG TPA: SDR family oxidoreductase [Pyrinomonadaceae bacterium]|nr:SDR family oxidoreductase [Pyrinomonadaceae bacterium]